jgi:hypothetical protein
MEGDCLPYSTIIGADAAILEDQNKYGKALYIFKFGTGLINHDHDDDDDDDFFTFS